LLVPHWRVMSRKSHTSTKTRVKSKKDTPRLHPSSKMREKERKPSLAEKVSLPKPCQVMSRARATELRSYAAASSLAEWLMRLH